MSAFGNVLRTDLRRIWPQVCLWFVAALLCYTLGLRISTQANRGFNPHLYLFLYWVSWASLFPSIVQRDAVLGTREFWMTRPISWSSLFAAKMTTAFLVGPVLALSVHGVFLATQGFTLFEVLRAFVWFGPCSVLMMTGLLFIAAVTPNATRFWFTVTALSIGVLVFFATVMWEAGKESNYPLGDINVTLGFLLYESSALVGVFWQYRTRATGQTVLALSVAIVAILALVAARPFKLSRVIAARSIEKRDTVDLKSVPDANVEGNAVQKSLALKVAVEALPPTPFFFDGGVIHEHDGLNDFSGVAFVSGGSVNILRHVGERIGTGFSQLNANPREQVVWLHFPKITMDRALAGQLEGKVYGRRLRFDCLGQASLRDGERLASGSLRIQIIKTPIGSKQRELIVQYQASGSRGRAGDWPALALVNSARKEWYFLAPDASDSEMFEGLPGLTVRAVTWVFEGATDRSHWQIELNDDWLKEAQLWAFVPTPEGEVEVPFTLELPAHFWAPTPSLDDAKTPYLDASSEEQKL